MTRERPENIEAGARCPGCDRVTDDATPVEEGKTPQPGNVMICVFCSAPAILTDQRTLRRPTPEELIELMEEPDFRRALDVSIRMAPLIEHVYPDYYRDA